jgi:hypothetical protein
MSRTSNQTARAERHARRFAASVAKNRMPAPTQDLEDYLDRFPEDVFVALEGFVEHANTGGGLPRERLEHRSHTYRV